MEHRKEVYKLLLELNKADTWEGINPRGARRFIESYVLKIDSLYNEPLSNKITNLLKKVSRKLGLTKIY